MNLGNVGSPAPKVMDLDRERIAHGMRQRADADLVEAMAQGIFFLQDQVKALQTELAAMKAATKGGDK